MESDSVNVSFQLEDLMPRSNIETLSQGVFLGKVADTYDNQFGEKFFCGKILIDMDEYKRKKKLRQLLPMMTDFDEKRIRQDVLADSEHLLIEKLKKEIVDESPVHYEEDELEEIAAERLRRTSPETRNAEIEAIAKKKCKESIDKRINNNFLKIQRDVQMIVDKMYGAGSSQ